MPTPEPQVRGGDSVASVGASAATIQASHVARTLPMSSSSDSVNRRAATPRIKPKSTTAAAVGSRSCRIDPSSLAPSDQVGPPVVAALIRLQHAVDGRLRRERRAPHHDERALLGGRVLEQLQIGVEGGAQHVERGDVLGDAVLTLQHVQRRCGHAVLRPAGEPRHERVLRSEVVGRQAAARPGSIRRSWPGTSARLHARRSTLRRRRAAPARTCCRRSACVCVPAGRAASPGIAREGTRTDVTCWFVSK